MLVSIGNAKGVKNSINADEEEIIKHLVIKKWFHLLPMGGEVDDDQVVSLPRKVYLLLRLNSPVQRRGVSTSSLVIYTRNLVLRESGPCTFGRARL